MEDEDRQRQEAAPNRQDTTQAQGQPGQYGRHNMLRPQTGGPQLPPIGYQPGAGKAPGQYPHLQKVDGAQQYGGSNQMYHAQG